MKIIIITITIAVSLTSCATKKPSPAPQYAGIVRQAQDAGKTIQTIRDGSKEVKSLQRESLSLIDRLDFKTTILLQP